MISSSWRPSRRWRSRCLGSRDLSLRRCSPISGFGLKAADGLDITGKWVELLSFMALNLMLLIVLVPDRAIRLPGRAGG